MDETPATNRHAPEHRDPVVAALRRLLNATDRNLAAADQLRKARIQLAKLVENRPGMEGDTEGDADG